LTSPLVPDQEQPGASDKGGNRFELHAVGSVQDGDDQDRDGGSRHVSLHALLAQWSAGRSRWSNVIRLAETILTIE